MKVCEVCQAPLPAGSNNNAKTCSRTCGAALQADRGRAYRKAHPERMKFLYDRYRKANQAKCSSLALACKFKTLYGITFDDYEAMLKAQNGLCAICGGQCSVKKRLSVDHDHTTGAVRGLLCIKCNCAIGYLKDSTDLARKALEYLVNASNGIGPAIRALSDRRRSPPEQSERTGS